MAEDLDALLEQANDVYADYEVAGVPATGEKDVEKPEVRALWAANVAAHEETRELAAAASVGLRWTSNRVRVRSTGNVALATALENGDTLNGVTLATGDHVFLGSQTDPKENGIYTVVASGAASRATWADSAAELAFLAFVIQEGTAGAGEQWALNLAEADITVGTTSLAFSPVGIQNDASAEVIAARGGEASLSDRLATIEDEITAAVGLGIATGDPTWSAGWDEFEVLAPNSVRYLEAGSGTNYAIWGIDALTEGQQATIVYWFDEATGAVPFGRLRNSDSSLGAQVNLVTDGKVQTLTLTVDTGKTANQFRVGTAAAAAGKLTAFVFAGGSLDEVARGLGSTPAALVKMLKAIASLQQSTVGADLGIATTDATQSNGWDSFTKRGRNGYRGVETGGTSNNATWTIPARTSSQSLLVGYRVNLSSGLPPWLRLVYSDGTFSSLTALTSDGVLHFLPVAPDTGKTAIGVQFRTVGNTDHEAICFVLDGADEDDALNNLSGAALMAFYAAAHGSPTGGRVSRLADEPGAFFGDSITGNGTFPDRVGTLLNAPAYNFGVGGTRAGLSSTYYNPLSGVNITAAIRDADFEAVIDGAVALADPAQGNGPDVVDRMIELSELNITTLHYAVLGYGANDQNGGRPIGTNSDSTDATWKGSIRLMVENLRTVHPTLHIVIGSPWHRLRNAADDGLDSDTYPNLVSVGAAVAAEGNAGSATISAPSGVHGMPVGDYTIKALSSTTFEVRNPDGTLVRTAPKDGDEVVSGTVGVAFASVLSLTMSGTPAPDDEWTVPVVGHMMSEYVEAAREMAALLRCHFKDNYGLYIDPYLDDGLHPDEDGDQFVAESYVGYLEATV